MSGIEQELFLGDLKALNPALVIDEEATVGNARCDCLGARGRRFKSCRPDSCRTSNRAAHHASRPARVASVWVFSARESCPAYLSHPKIQSPIPHRTKGTLQYWTGTE
jgi:hypothetical protein